ncbi:MAG: hypothetical protein LBB81_07610, partial [Treponema sp.]|nr:hypothetical protein [Treponema sp.]
LPSLNKIIQAVTIILFLALASCESPVGGGGSSGGGGGSGGGTSGSSGGGVKANVTNSNRYQAIPDNSTGNDKIKYSYTYGGYDFYYIYLGQLGNIPLFYDAAKRHSRNYSSSTYTWSTTSATTSTVSNAVTQASQETVSVTNEHTVEKTSEYKFHEEASMKFKGLFVSAEAKVSADQHFKNFTSDTTINGFQKTTSLTNTVEYTTSNTESLRQEQSYTLTSADKEGYYRYTYFSFSDVYLYVIRNPATKEIYYEFREYIVPGKNFWDLDYCETLDFKKSDTTRFSLDISILNNLPVTKEKFDGGGDTPLPPPLDPTIWVTNNGEWNGALSYIKSLGSGTAVNPNKYTIGVTGDVMVFGNTTATLGAVSNVEVTLKGNGRLYLSNRGFLLNIGSAQTIIIDSPDLVLQGLSSENGGVDNNDSAVRINTGGKLELKNGTIKSNRNKSSGNVTSRRGGGVYVDSGGIFTMSGGTISGNSSDSSSSGDTKVTITSDSRGGGVYVLGSFTMTGGTISGNWAYGISAASGYTSKATSTSYGGGVYVENGSFTMSGGAIFENTSQSVSSTNSNSYGGGVCVANSSSFTMSGGTINGNTAHGHNDTREKDSSSNGYGGGVCVISGSFTMTGGTFMRNAANAASNGVAKNTYGYGGGVCVYLTGTFSKSGDTIIYGNDALDSLRNGAQTNGHAAYRLGFSLLGIPTYYRNTTAGPDVNLSTSSTSGWNQ